MQLSPAQGQLLVFLGVVWFGHSREGNAGVGADLVLFFHLSLTVMQQR